MRFSKILLSASLLALAPLHVSHAGAGSDNHAAVFIGQTDGYSTLGIEYEYRTNLLDRMIGIGAVVEQFSGTGYDALVSVLGVVVHPWKDLKINVSAGVESKSYSNGDSGDYNLTRIGVGYDFHISGVSIGPVYNSDTIVGTGTVDVYGIAIGMGF